MKIIDETGKGSNKRYDVIDAVYLGNFRLKVSFSDSVVKEVDFYPFLSEAWNPVFKKYLQEKYFKKFKITYGNINWNDYEMIFPVAHLHRGEIKFIPPTLPDGMKPSRFYEQHMKHLNGKSHTNGIANKETQLGIKLRLAREAKGMTQAQAARRLKMNPSTISRIENHSDDIRLSTLQKYARVLGRTIKLEVA